MLFIVVCVLCFDSCIKIPSGSGSGSDERDVCCILNECCTHINIHRDSHVSWTIFGFICLLPVMAFPDRSTRVGVQPIYPHS